MCVLELLICFVNSFIVINSVVFFVKGIGLDKVIKVKVSVLKCVVISLIDNVVLFGNLVFVLFGRIVLIVRLSMVDNRIIYRNVVNIYKLLEIVFRVINIVGESVVIVKIVIWWVILFFYIGGKFW